MQPEDTGATCTTMTNAAYLDDVQPARPGQSIGGAAIGSTMCVSHNGMLPITSDISVKAHVTKDCGANMIRIGDLLNQHPYLAMHISAAKKGKHAMQLVDERNQQLLVSIDEWNNVFPLALRRELRAQCAQPIELQEQPYQLHAVSAAAAPVSTSDAEPALPPPSTAPSQAPKRPRRKVSVTTNARTTGWRTRSTVTLLTRSSR